MLFILNRAPNFTSVEDGPSAISQNRVRSVMGCAPAKNKPTHDDSSIYVSPNTTQQQQQRVFAPIRDRFETIEEVQRAIRQAGLESSDLILAIDFTISNVDQGAQSFGGLCLHNTQTGSNPYMQTIDIIGRTMATFDDDNLIPVYGFGDKTTGARTCFPFMPHGAPCNGLEHALQRYQELAPIVQLDGPTCFAAVINVAIAHVCETGGYHILFIVADGQVTDGTSTGPTAQAIVRASNYALSIVVVGVGDGDNPSCLMHLALTVLQVHGTQ